MKKQLSLLICLMLVLGCASMAQQTSLDKLPESNFSVEIPAGWWKPEQIDKYLITRDGPFQQYVLIQERPINKPFRHTQKKVRSGMLPQEAAGVIIDELASDRYLANFSVLENGPAVIDGHDGFKILFYYKDKKGTEFKTLYYGFIRGDSFFNLRYCAAVQDYFEKDLPTFEKMIVTFKLIDT
jgi:hypothetical protein